MEERWRDDAIRPDDRAPAGVPTPSNWPWRATPRRPGSRPSCGRTTTSFPGPDDNPTTDAWTVLGGLARETERIGLGVLVSPVTFRHAGTFAKVVTTVDECRADGSRWGSARAGMTMSTGRTSRLPGHADRAEMLEETLAILHGLWEEPDGWSFQGKHWQVVGERTSERSPRPPQALARGEARPRILVGGWARRGRSRIAAQFADEFNVTSSNRARPPRPAMDEALRTAAVIRRSSAPR